MKRRRQLAEKVLGCAQYLPRPSRQSPAMDHEHTACPRHDHAAEGCQVGSDPMDGTDGWRGSRFPAADSKSQTSTPSQPRPTTGSRHTSEQEREKCYAFNAGWLTSLSTEFLNICGEMEDQVAFFAPSEPRHGYKPIDNSLRQAQVTRLL